MYSTPYVYQHVQCVGKRIRDDPPCNGDILAYLFIQCVGKIHDPPWCDNFSVILPTYSRDDPPCKGDILVYTIHTVCGQNPRPPLV